MNKYRFIWIQPVMFGHDSEPQQEQQLSGPQREAHWFGLDVMGLQHNQINPKGSKLIKAITLKKKKMI